MRGLCAAVISTVFCSLSALGSPAAATTDAQDLELDAELPLDVIFSDGFESEECAAWSASSNPPGAPDLDDDGFGDATQPTVYCELPAGFAPNDGDCDDGDADVYPGATELCNGTDDDCDGVTADGSEDPQLGVACDGGDTDLCVEGTRTCVAGSLACSDQTSSTYDVCNGVDDDCEAASSDGSEDPLNGTVCDGVDSDLCAEGTRTCVAGSLACSDGTGSTLDVCNGVDDDCDGASADGSEDPLNGAVCDGTDGDLCLEGNWSCDALAETLLCSDQTGTTVEICNGFDDDCDGAIDEGCRLRR